MYKYLISSWVTVMLFAIASYGQTGLGGVGSSSTMPFWYDVSELGLSNNSSVGALTDFSGNGNNATQTNASARPTYKTNQLNGKSVLSFDGSDVLSTAAIAGLNNKNDIYWFVVYDSPSSSSNRAVLSSKYAGTGFQNTYSWASSILGTTKFLTYAPRAANQANIQYNFNTSYNIHHGQYNGSSDAMSAYMNQTLQSSLTGIDGNLTTHQSTVIGRNSYNLLGFFTGNIAEIVAYTTILNTTQQVIIHNALSAKYGIGITTDRYAHDASHGNAVAGIGRTGVSDAHTQAQGNSILRIRNASSLDSGDYLMWGHDGGDLTTTEADVPASYVGTGGERLNRVWKADEFNTDVGTVTIIFNMSGIGFGIDPDQYELLTDSDGTFSNALSTGTSPTFSGDSVIFTGVNLPDDHFFTIGNSNAVNTCSSLTSDTWASVLWDCGTVPDSTKNVSILAGTNVTISDARTVNDISIEGTLTITAAGSLVVKGEFLVESGGLTAFDDQSTVIFRGEQAQTITNSDDDAIVFGNLEVNNANGLTLVNDGEVHMSRGLSLTAGELSCLEPLRMLSIEGLQSAVISVGATGDLTGTIQMDRFIVSRAASWATFSSPVSDADFEQIDDDIFISGVTGGDGFAAGFISLWQYDEVANDYLAVSNTTNAMQQGRGYELWLADNNTTWNDGTIDYVGSPDLDEISISLNTTGGWNLIGNPYPAFLSWTSVLDGVTGISGDAYYIYDNVTSQYVERTLGTNIPPGQGFWVHSSTNSLTLTPSADFANSSTSEFFKAASISHSPRLSISLESVDSPLKHTAHVRNNPKAFAGYDEYDLTMLRSPDTLSCQVALESSEGDLLINHVSTDLAQMTIPFNVTAGTPGTYTLKLDGLENMSEYHCINLLDKQLNLQVPVTSAHELNLLLEEDKPQFFELILSRADYDDCIVEESAFSNDPVEVFANDKEIYVSYFIDKSTTAQVEVFDLTGNKVFAEKQQAGFNRERISLEGSSAGIYLINVSFENGTAFSRKVFIQ